MNDSNTNTVVNNNGDGDNIHNEYHRYDNATGAIDEDMDGVENTNTDDGGNNGGMVMNHFTTDIIDENQTNEFDSTEHHRNTANFDDDGLGASDGIAMMQHGIAGDTSNKHGSDDNQHDCAADDDHQTSTIANDGHHRDHRHPSFQQDRREDQDHQERSKPSNRHQHQQDEAEAFSEASATMQVISEKFDDKFNNYGSLIKRLLQEAKVYAQSMEKVENKYRQIQELENNESARLDTVEPEVQGASGMLLSNTGAGGNNSMINGNVGGGMSLGINGGNFLSSNSHQAHQTQQQHHDSGDGRAERQQQLTGPNSVSKRYVALSPKFRPSSGMRYQRDGSGGTGDSAEHRHLTPIVNSRRNGKNGEGLQDLRRSFV